MNVITNDHGPGKLATKVFIASESGFNVTSTIVMGQEECIIIDTQWTRANALRVIAEVIETGLKVKAVYVTHAHPDHYWGLGEIAAAFPEAKCYAPEPVVTLYHHQYQPKLDEWEERIGSGNLCRRQCDRLEPLKDTYLELDGERLEIIRCMGDLMWNTMVWIPSIRTAVCSDVVFNQAHPFTCEVSRKQRMLWMKDIEGIRALDPEVVIPGHMKDDLSLDMSSLDFMEQYLIATEEEIDGCADAPEFFYHMFKRFPEATLLALSNEMNAEVFKGGREWSWGEDPDPKWLEFPTAWLTEPDVD